MARWNGKCLLYKFSLVCSYFIFLVYALAFSIPMWLGKNKLIIGLWAEGSGDDDDIDDVSDTGFGEGVIDDAWFDAVRGLMLGGTAFFLFGVIAGLVENCCLSSSTKDHGITGVFILLAGLCGTTAVILTAVKIEEEDEYDPIDDYRWGFILAVVASGLAIILSIVLLITKNFDVSETVKSSRTADYVYAHKQGPYGPDYHNQGYRGDELPLVNGVPYQPQTPYAHSPYNMYRRGNDNGYLNNKYEQGSGYYPYGYKDSRPGNRTSMAESADLSNGFTPDIVYSEHSLGRRIDYGGRPQNQNVRGDYFYSGSRPY